MLLVVLLQVLGEVCLCCTFLHLHTISSHPLPSSDLLTF